jgi:hypothetical protein
LYSRMHCPTAALPQSPVPPFVGGEDMSSTARPARPASPASPARPDRPAGPGQFCPCLLAKPGKSGPYPWAGSPGITRNCPVNSEVSPNQSPTGKEGWHPPLPGGEGIGSVNLATGQFRVIRPRDRAPTFRASLRDRGMSSRDCPGRVSLDMASSAHKGRTRHCRSACATPWMDTRAHESTESEPRPAHVGVFG